ncbi:MAG TPA: hypothetical protein VGN74_12660 [Brevundimonas sp.]|jgi:hypothetical protein|uniref:hypothetical protein n=1 Tax=Brevundimonas sp. TaxID=1871086 RepID=UPI002E111456|nr:hypothetical protein [Brevundimonas sp.]
MLGVLVAAAMIVGDDAPADPHRRMIAEAQAIVRQDGDRLWEGWSQAPLPILLIGPDEETLFCDAPVDGFLAAGFDPVTRCAMQSRPREQPTDLAAALDLAGRQVIQMGRMAALETTEAEWTTIVLHEAFHQYQSTLPAYAEAVNDLRRTFGEADSQWMLDYDFPYADPAVKAAFADMTTSALRFLETPSGPQARASLADYVRARRAAAAAAGPTAWRYYEFQAGQEGVARWSELKLAALAGESRPDIAAVAQDNRLGLAVSLRAIDSQGLDLWRRSVFYVLGAIEAEMLEQVRPNWRREYPARPFSLGEMLEASVAGSP